MPTACAKPTTYSEPIKAAVSFVERVETTTEADARFAVYSGPEDPTPNQAMKLVECSGALDFWDDEGEDGYSDSDGEPV